MKEVKLISITKLARKIGISAELLRYHVTQEYLLKPSYKIGKRFYYTDKESKQVEDYFYVLKQTKGEHNV